MEKDSTGIRITKKIKKERNKINQQKMTGKEKWK